MLRAKDRAALQGITGEKPKQAAPAVPAVDQLAAVSTSLLQLSQAINQNAAASLQVQADLSAAIKQLAERPEPKPAKIGFKADVKRDQDGRMKTVIITSI